MHKINIEYRLAAMFRWPRPPIWNNIYQQLVSFHPQKGNALQPEPPKPLILSGWVFSSASEKHERWLQTVAWAVQHGNRDIVDSVPESDFVTWMSDQWAWEPPTYGSQVHPPKPRLDTFEAQRLLAILRSHWAQIAGEPLARITYPYKLTGGKRRRLVVQADPAAMPPWESLYYFVADRISFTRFRRRINDAVSPHEIDHIVFKTDNIPKGLLQTNS